MVPEPLTISRILQFAQAHQRAGRLKEAETCYQRVLAEQPNHAEALFSLGMLAFGDRRLESALDFMQKAAAADPTVADFTCNVGAILDQLHRRDEAEQAYRRAIQINPRCAAAHNNLSKILLEKSDTQAALTEAQNALDIQPEYPEALCNRAIVLEAMNRIDDAIADYRHSLRLRPDIVEANANLVRLLALNRRYDEAIEICRHAIRRWPDMAAPYVELGVLYQKKNDPESAISQYLEVLKRHPNLAVAYNNLGMAYQDLALAEPAIASFRAAIRLQPDKSEYYSDLIYALQLNPDDDPQKIAREQRDWSRLHAQPLAKFIQSHDNDRSPDRPLRIGFVSPDFRQHVVGLNMLPLLKHHDPGQFEIFCYSSVSRPDEVTHLLQQAGGQWRNIAGVSDERAAEMIRADKIDILVDLALHTAGNRLLVFARKPAPVQVCYLGQLCGTGMAAIDYRLSDRFIDPPDADLTVYSERTIRLPHCYWCYEPDEACPDVSPPPAEQSGFVTFGCLNNLRKVSAPCLDLWMRTMAAVPRSRMLIHSYPSTRLDAICRKFEQGGIEPDRLEFVGAQSRRDYFRTFARIDIALDPFPYNGGVTTCDTLWMGVPVVTVVGRTAAGRPGSSILHNIGLSELVAFTKDQYLQIAAELVGAPTRLAELRAAMRQRMQSSPLMDATQFARDIESAYRQMWRTWCENR
jgi:protein O-GlcNAc transferase